MPASRRLRSARDARALAEAGDPNALRSHQTSRSTGRRCSNPSMAMKDFARELADAYIGTGDRELAAIAAALGTGDAAAMRESAHTLKGASANLRAPAATSAAAQLEAAAGSGESAQIAALAEKLKSEIERTIEYLQSKVA